MPPTLKDLQNIPNAAQPTPGQGLTLDHNGLVPPIILAPTPSDLKFLQYNNTTKQAQWAAGVDPTTLAGYQLSYVETTSTQTTTVTSSATAVAITTAASITFDGTTAVLIEFWADEIWNSVADQVTVIELYQDSADLGILGRGISPKTDQGPPIYGARRLTPTAGAKVYSVRLWGVAAGTSSVGAGVGTGGADMPMFIRITRA